MSNTNANSNANTNICCAILGASDPEMAAIEAALMAAGIPADGMARENHGAPLRVCRGGSWPSSAVYCRSAYRSRLAPDWRFRQLGFRLAQFVN